jgi:hypothetical protein
MRYCYGTWGKATWLIVMGALLLTVGTVALAGTGTQGQRPTPVQIVDPITVGGRVAVECKPLRVHVIGPGGQDMGFMEFPFPPRPRVVNDSQDLPGDIIVGFDGTSGQASVIKFVQAQAGGPLQMEMKLLP